MYFQQKPLLVTPIKWEGVGNRESQKTCRIL